MAKSKRQLDREIDTFLHGVDHLDRRWHGSEVQSLLFERPQWTARTAKAWAAKHSYRSAKVHLTDNYVRLRQFEPVRGTKKRIITFGNGIRAVIEQVK